MRIFYLCPDFGAPSGGTKQIYTHVAILKENGFDAYVLHTSSEFKVTWFDSDVPILYSSDSVTINDDDVVVIPEGHPEAMKNLSSLPMKKVVISLNPLYMFASLSPGESWQDYGIEWVMAGAMAIEDLVREDMGIKNVATVGIGVDLDMFHYTPGIKKFQAAYITRKDLHSPIVEIMVKTQKSSLRNLEFVKIENLHIADYAQVLKTSDIFMVTSIHEGIHWSVLEAMACGCICVGYHGIGAKDFIVEAGDQQNFVLAENANFVDLARKFAELARMIEQKDPRIELIRQNAISTAAKYSPEFEKETVLRFWNTFFASENKLQESRSPNVQR